MDTANAAGRILLGIPLGFAPRGPIEAAFELARWLGSGIEAVLMPHAGLQSLGVIPFAREFQPLLNAWTDVGVERIERDRRAAIRRCEEEIARFAAGFGVPGLVRVAEGEAAAALDENGRPGAVIAIPAPRRRGEEQFTLYPLLIEQALRGPSSTLLLPQPSARRSGPVLAVVQGDDDPARDVAERIARAADAKLVIARHGEAPGSAPRSMSSAGLRERGLVLSGDVVRALTGGWRDMGERVVVLSSRAAPCLAAAAALDIVLARRVPLLIVK